MAELTNNELVTRSRAGDKDAFGQLAESCRQQALRMSERIVTCEETAKDIVQDAVLTAWLSITSLRDPAAFASWLYGIVLNLSNNHIRRRRAEISLDSLLGGRLATPEELLDTGPSADEILYERELADLIRASVQHLPPRTQRAAVLFYLEGLSLRETAALMGVATGTVKAQLYSARQRLRDELLVAVVGELPLEEARLNMTAVTIWDVCEAPNDAHVVILLDPATDRVIPISIGAAEGRALVMGLKEISIPRPQTYTLMADIINQLDAKLTAVRIEKLVGTTFYAVLVLSKEGENLEVDCRPSDAMCLAVHADVPVQVASELLDQFGKPKGEVLKKSGGTIPMDGTAIETIAARIQRNLTAEGV